MIVATYKSNCKSQPEHIRVHKYASDGKLRVEAIGNSYAKEIGGVYEDIGQVENFLSQRSVFGYSLVIKA